jgi:hypothetical protein
MYFGCKKHNMFGQTISYKMERMPPKRNTMGEVRPLRPYTWNGIQVWIEKRPQGGVKENSQEAKTCVRFLIQLNVDRDINFQKKRWKGENLKTFKFHIWSKGA